MPVAFPHLDSCSTSNEVALQLLEHTRLPLDAPLLDLGAGSSSLLPVLLEEGYTNLLAVDLSEEALRTQAQQLSAEQQNHVLWLVDDVTQPQHLWALDPVLLWHDRRMLSVLTLAEQQEAYRVLLAHMVLPVQGWVLLSVLRPGSATRQGDFSVQPYELEHLKNFLGEEFILHDHYLYQQEDVEGNKQPSLYALFQRAADPDNTFRR